MWTKINIVSLTVTNNVHIKLELIQLHQLDTSTLLTLGLNRQLCIKFIFYSPVKKEKKKVVDRGLTYNIRMKFGFK